MNFNFAPIQSVSNQVLPLPIPSSQSKLNNYESTLDAPLHDIIKQSVEGFKTYWKEQKAMKDEISLFSVKYLQKINNEVYNCQMNLDQLQARIVKSALATQKLKDKTLQEIRLAEYSSRIKDSSSIYNTFNAPDFEYFNGLINDYQEQVLILSQNLKEVNAALDSNSSFVKNGVADAKTLVEISKYLQESIINVASNLQTVHQVIQSYKVGGIGYGSIALQPASQLTFKPFAQAEALSKIPAGDSMFQPSPQLLLVPNLESADFRTKSGLVNAKPSHDNTFLDRGQSYYACLTKSPTTTTPSSPPTTLRGIIKRSAYSPSP